MSKHISSISGLFNNFSSEMMRCYSCRIIPPVLLTPGAAAGEPAVSRNIFVGSFSKLTVTPAPGCFLSARWSCLLVCLWLL